MQWVNTPASITKIGQAAFSGCVSLLSFVLPSKLDHLGSGAFSNCKSLTEIRFPACIKKIPEESFDHCTKLQRVSFCAIMTTQNQQPQEKAEPLGHFSIGKGAFKYCKSLRHVRLPEYLVAIEACAFSNCSTLQELLLPDNVTLVGDSAFSQCGQLTNVQLGSIKNGSKLKTIGTSAFASCSNVRDLVVPSSVETVGQYAFAGLGSLRVLAVRRSAAAAAAAGSYVEAVNSSSLPAPFTVNGWHTDAFAGTSRMAAVNVPHHIVWSLGGKFRKCKTLFDAMAEVPNCVLRPHEVYNWNIRTHCGLTPIQQQCISAVLHVGAKARLFWRPVNGGPRSEPITLHGSSLPLPCIPNDVWLQILGMLQRSDVGPA